jgi:ribulose-5-phosphate 4-epimerase/fuculose-1-phosphate aldolase
MNILSSAARRHFRAKTSGRWVVRVRRGDRMVVAKTGTWFSCREWAKNMQAYEGEMFLARADWERRGV